MEEARSEEESTHEVVSCEQEESACFSQTWRTKISKPGRQYESRQPAASKEEVAFEIAIG